MEKKWSMNTQKISYEKYHDLLVDAEPACKNRFCFYRMYMEKQHPSIFIVVQILLMVKMKYIWETESHKDIGFEPCAKRWNVEQFDVAYRQAFEEAADTEDVEALFKRTIELQKNIPKVFVDNVIT